MHRTAGAASVSVEQRASFRIIEDVMLACLVLPPDADRSRPVHAWFDPSDGFALEARLDELDHGYRECHARLARINATAAEAADWLSAKLDALKDALLAQRRSAAQGLKSSRVSLAITGIGFAHPSALAIGQPLAVHVVLGSSHESIMSYATVRNCRAENESSWIGAEFEGLSADQQRRLSRHILQSEIRQRKQ